ncbi:gas vesicle protein GvpJ [Halomarina litorea]|uniref:gas vesicle protein n=1 Tax=Halomarina litorea TaxID=2961595 RepID=UPI0020C33425
MLLDKGIVINADIAVTVGETELLGIHIRAALASFETAAKYGLQFPDGTDMRRVEEASGRSQMHSKGGSPISVRSPGTTGISPAPRGGERPGDEDDGSDEDDEETGASDGGESSSPEEKGEETTPNDGEATEDPDADDEREAPSDDEGGEQEAESESGGEDA